MRLFQGLYHYREYHAEPKSDGEAVYRESLLKVITPSGRSTSEAIERVATLLTKNVLCSHLCCYEPSSLKALLAGQKIYTTGAIYFLQKPSMAD